MQGHLLLNGLFDDVGADAHPTALDGPLADGQALLNHLEGLTRATSDPGRPGHAGGRGRTHRAVGSCVVAGPTGLAPGGFLLVEIDRSGTLQDVGRTVDEALVPLCAQQDVAATHALGIGDAIFVRHGKVHK